MRSAAAALLLSAGTAAWDPFNLAPTPPMGWANWNGFGCNYTADTIKRTADKMVASGMRDAGYDIIIIQECITRAGHRDSKGVPQPDPEKFPDGIKGLVDYIHSKGMRAGIYTDVGPETCAGYEGSYGHEDIDALTYAQWGIDFVEEDACHKPAGHLYKDLYWRMHNAILSAHNQTGHPMMFYMCVWGSENVYEWGPSHGTLWRTTEDICAPGHASWDRMLGNFRGDTRFPNATQIGAWQDPDMLVVGMSGLTEEEWRSHFSLWAMAAAPLWAGVDLDTIPPAALQILLNREVIAVDQDARGVMGRPLDVPTPPPAPKCVGNSTVFPVNITGVQCEGLSKAAAASPEACAALCCAGGCRTWLYGEGGCWVGDKPCVGPANAAWSGGSTDPVNGGSVMAKPLTAAAGESVAAAVLLFNPSAGPADASFPVAALSGFDAAKPVRVRDLWAHAELGSFTGSFAASGIPSHGVRMLRVSQ
eukprot:TRINITY_DN42911_c0_g1_i1.p1 TRINITY_DN42911_c0_g1~~TRINITY_DN42911_c0_g1_i1.p1  ORF type:complete len:496 (+),score=137.97 TRINITY_DN42911_c0_g1_i1:63-1490(+)